jgi:TRAP-type C4-dicarboxylate transport system substrate-binding protein
MLRFIRPLVTLAAVVAVAVTLSAQAATRIRLATFAPANTSWHKALLEFKASAEKATAGRVTIDIFPGGTQGPESSVVSFLRIGQLQAALLMPSGLSLIDPSINVFGLPFFVKDDAELKHLLETIGPEVARRLDAKGFQLLNWGSAG